MKRLLLAFVFLLPVSVQAAEHVLIPMLGATSWSEDSGHTARGSAIVFEDDNNPTLGFKYLYMYDSGFAWGGNIYVYNKDVVTAGQAKDAVVSHVHALAEYYFNSKGNVSPFIGAGIGFTGITFNEGVLDEESSSGGSIELNGGVKFRVSESFSLQLEYKYTNFDVDEDIDSLNTNINTDSQSLMVGVAMEI